MSQAEKRSPGGGLRIVQLEHQFESAAVEPHAHAQECELVYLRQGLAELTIDGRQFSARSGALIAVDADVTHGGTYAASDRSGKLERYVLRLADVPDGHLVPEGCGAVVQPDLGSILTALFQLLEREYLARERGWETVCADVLDVLLTLIARTAVPFEPAPAPASQAQALAGEILAYLHVHYCENISLQSVADHFYISPYYLSHLMKKHLQVPLMQYVIHLRISEARALLRDTDYPVKQIAQMVGYQNFNYFLNVFKKMTGMSPGDCRTASRG